MQTLNSSSYELVNYLEEPFKDHEKNDQNGLIEPTTSEFIDKVGKKRQRKTSESETCLEINEMWDSINKDNSSSKVVLTKEEAEAEIEKIFNCGSRKKMKKIKRTPTEIAMEVENVMANLEIAVEDDVEQNRQGKPAINKLMKLPLLVEALLKKQLQATFLDHGLLNLLKNWLEPLPDGSLPNLNIRATVLTVLNDLHINLEQDCRREQLKKSGLGKVIMFYSKSDEETIHNKKLANDLLNKWGRSIYNKSTRYDNKSIQEEIEEEQRILLRRQQTKKAPTVVESSQRIARDFNIDLVLIRQPTSYPGPPIGVGRAQLPKAMSMDFKIRPGSKTDQILKPRSQIHVKMIMDKLTEINIKRRRSLQLFKPSLNGRTKATYLKPQSRHISC